MLCSYWFKNGEITHQDVGQIDMYVRMYDDLKCKEGDNPTLGILLCSETDEDIARYSILHDNDRLFMSKYLTYLPSKEQLKAEIDHQKWNILYATSNIIKKMMIKDEIWKKWFYLTRIRCPHCGHETARVDAIDR